MLGGDAGTQACATMAGDILTEYGLTAEDAEERRVWAWC